MCTVTLCYILHQTHSEFWDIQQGCFRYMSAYSLILSVRHIHEYWDIIKAYSGMFMYPSVIHSLVIFWVQAYLELEAYLKPWNVDQAYSDPCHEALLSHNLAYSEPCAMLAHEKPGILGILEYFELFHTASWWLFRTLSCLRKFTNIQKFDIF